MIDQIHESEWPAFMPQAEPTKGSAKEQLAKQAESFYGWYLSVRKESYPPEGYQGLQHIMQICKKNTLSEHEALEALRGLKELIEKIVQVWHSEDKEKVTAQAEKVVEIFEDSVYLEGDQLPDKSTIARSAEILFHISDPSSLMRS